MVKKHGRKPKAQIQEDAANYFQSRNIRADLLVEKWSKTPYGVGLDTLHSTNTQKARNTAMLLENQERHLKKLNETTISQNFSTRPENVLKVVRIGSANSNRGDFATEFPLSTVDDAIFYVDMVYEDTLRGATADDKIYEKINRFYAGEMYEEVGTQSGTTHTFAMTYFPLVRGKTMIMVDRKLAGYSNGSSGFTALDATLITAASCTIDNATGVVVVETVASQSIGDVVILAQFDSENSTMYTNYGKVSLTVSKKRFNARPQPLGFTYSNMVELMLGGEGLGNAEDMLIKAVGDELSKSKDYKAIGLLRSVALLNDVYTFDTDFAAAGEVSDKLHAQKLLSKLGSISGVLYDDIKRGKINKAITGSQALEYCRKHDSWVEDTTQNRIGVYYAGKLADIDVFCCPAESNLVANDEMLLTYKNPDEGMDVGIAFGVLTELTASLAYPQFYVDGNIASVEDYLVLNQKFVRKLKLENLSFG